MKFDHIRRHGRQGGKLSRSVPKTTKEKKNVRDPSSFKSDALLVYSTEKLNHSNAPP